MSRSTSEFRVRLAPWNRFKPFSKILYWPFQCGTSFVDLVSLFCLVFYAFVLICLFVPCGHLLGKGWPLGSRLWCITVSLSFSHWYPGSSVVLDCIDSWAYPHFMSQWWHAYCSIGLKEKMDRILPEWYLIVSIPDLCTLTYFFFMLK